MAISIPNILVIIISTYYTSYIIFMLSKNKRKGVVLKNTTLNNIRLKKVKTLEEQKEFLNVKYPKRGKFKWKNLKNITWRAVGKFLLNLAVYILLFRGFLFILRHFNINFQYWQAILIVLTLPIIINMLLEKFNLQRNDLRVFFR